ncbi:MAG: DnaJ domain-containing protein, partial [Betaproteobacteria bacterium]|nr:DnaJ domain-containing protein [Betaproteobacteria bacterium]
MKTLYSILGVTHDASAAQIETAYASLLAQISQSQGENDRVRLIAIKEAYSVLSDPLKRQLYNQKLFAPEPVVVYGADSSSVPESFGWKKILVIGALAIGGLVIYSNNAREREKLRIEHEHEVQMRAVQVLESSQQQAEAEQEARLARQQQIDAQNRERQEKADFDRFNREADYRRIQNERLQQQQAQ